VVAAEAEVQLREWAAAPLPEVLVWLARETPAATAISEEPAFVRLRRRPKGLGLLRK